jgi:hypothetical protein
MTSIHKNLYHIEINKMYDHFPLKCTTNTAEYTNVINCIFNYFLTYKSTTFNTYTWLDVIDWMFITIVKK